MKTEWFSLRRRLLLLLLGGVSLFWLATLTLSYVDAHHEIDELFDAQLVQTAQTLLALANHEGRGKDDDIAEDDDATHEYQRKLRFQVWRHDGILLLHSANAPTSALTELDGFSDGSGADNQQKHWRNFSQWDAERRFQVQVSEEHHIREELIGKIVGRLLLPALFGLPLLGAWLWLATRRGLAPLDEVAAQIGAREPGQLQALTPTRAPNEIRPLIEALNGLLGRIGQALENERRFTADAAHELRTPLAALAAQAQVAQRSTNSAERSRAIEQLRAGVDRAAHLIDQMLTLARLDPELPLANAQLVALRELTEETCAAQGIAALEKNISLELDAIDVSVMGSAALIQILLRNLLDNAIRYTAPGGQVRVMLQEDGFGALLRVSDNGPGIPAAEREQVFRRFHRLAGQEQTGSGLGLSIVQRIAELHDAKITLSETGEGGGLTVSVLFRSAAKAAPTSARGQLDPVKPGSDRVPAPVACRCRAGADSTTSKAPSES